MSTLNPAILKKFNSLKKAPRSPAEIVTHLATFFMTSRKELERELKKADPGFFETAKALSSPEALSKIPQLARETGNEAFPAQVKRMEGTISGLHRDL